MLVDELPHIAPRMSPGGVINHAIVTRDRGRRFLAVAGEDGWALPCVETPPGNWYDVEDVVGELAARHGVDVFVLRCVMGTTNVRPSSERAYAAQALDVPAGAGTWFDRDEGDVLEDPAQRDALTAYLSGPPPPEPWSREGWIDEVRSFVAKATGTPEPHLRQIRTWQRSCVLGLDGPPPLLFKAAPAFYRHEPELARWLGLRFPGPFPDVVASDRARGWMLMEELRGTPLHRIASLAPWRGALDSFARVQLDCVTATDELLALGAPDLRIPVLRAETDALLADREAMLPGDPDGLTHAEVAALGRFAGRIGELWDELEGCGVPASFEHGDFRPEHVMVSPHGHAFFDVSNGAVSHPFFSAVTMLDFEDLPAGDPRAASEAAVRAELRAAYLAPWARDHDEAMLERAFDAARPLAILHAALTRYRLLAHLEPREDWAFMVPYWLRQLLRSLGHRPDETEE